MAPQPWEQSLVFLRLRSKEQWLLHHVLLTRLEAWRRAPGEGQPPIELTQALEKVEAGSLQFTDAELRWAREILEGYRRRRDLPDDEQEDVAGIVDRINEALTRSTALTPG